LAKENAKQKESEHSSALSALKDHESKLSHLGTPVHSEEDTRTKAALSTSSASASSISNHAMPTSVEIG